ncbi:MAG: efflux RND transporter periplasmic adaptor subunit [Rhodothermaceae bacterium]
MRTNILLVALIMLMFLISACSGERKVEKLSNQTIKVSVRTAQKVKLEESIAYSGTVEAGKIMPVSFLATGTIEKVFVNEGDKVKKGTLLAKINDKTYKESYQVSLAALNRAQDAYSRLKPMYEKGNIPEIQFVEVETALKQAKSNEAIFKKNLKDCSLYSPGDGFVGGRSIEPGMNVGPGMQGITIVNIDKIKVKVPIPENEIAQIKVGQKAAIKIAALNDKKFEGAVDEVGVVAHPFAHTYDVKIAVDNKNKEIKPGMVCFVNITSANDNLTLAIPGSAISVDENGKQYVFVCSEDDSRVQKQIIKTGKVLKNKIEVIKGLNEGNKVVVSGHHKLSNNSKIKILN